MYVCMYVCLFLCMYDGRTDGWMVYHLHVYVEMQIT